MLQKYNGYPELQFIIDFLKQDPLPVLVVNRSYNICKPLKYYFQINNITDPIDFINFKNIRSTDLMNLDSSNYVILNKSDKIEKNNFKIVFETNDYQILKSIN